LRITEKPLSEQTFLFLGAGEAAVGIADLLVAALVDGGMSERDSKKRCWMVDSSGLVVASRNRLAVHKQAYAHEAPFADNLLDAIQQVRPTALIGVSGVPHTFDEAVVRAMSELNQRPIIFALSNPTANSECTAEEAYQWSQGRAIFASGSPFYPVTYNGKTYVPGQANNSYVFPGIGLGVIVSKATQVTDEMFLSAAQSLADLVTESDLEQGRIFPPLTEIRTISAHIAAVIWKNAAEKGIAREPLPANVIDVIRRQMYEPVYQNHISP
jgi:malate dehydrogenase (oxaloacetate-decarboxylating)(NADP+)